MALSALWKFVSEVNAYFHDMQPWVLAKNDHQMFVQVISATCHSLYSIGIMAWSIMPNKMELLLNALGCEFKLGQDYDIILRECNWDRTFTLQDLKEPLFVRPESTNEEVNEQEQKQTNQESSTMITIDDFLKLDIRVGTIKRCELVKGSDKLYCLQVDLGELGMRQILSGVAKQFTVEQMVDTQGAFIVNLAPRKMMGLESQGMMIFAKDSQGAMQIVIYSDEIDNGSKLC